MDVSVAVSVCLVARKQPGRACASCSDAPLTRQVFLLLPWGVSGVSVGLS